MPRAVLRLAGTRWAPRALLALHPRKQWMSVHLHRRCAPLCSHLPPGWRRRCRAPHRCRAPPAPCPSSRVQAATRAHVPYACSPRRPCALRSRSCTLSVRRATAQFERAPPNGDRKGRQGNLGRLGITHRGHRDGREGPGGARRARRGVRFLPYTDTRCHLWSWSSTLHGHNSRRNRIVGVAHALPSVRHPPRHLLGLAHRGAQRI